MSQDHAPKGVSTWATGLALFSMFFGAGNLIFPLLVGRAAGSESGCAVLGLGISAVLFPLLGLFAMMLYGGDLRAFLARLGRWPGAVLMALLYMSQGPVGAMPRHFTLMHASIKPYFPTLSLFAFSLALMVFVFCLTIRPRKMMKWLGSILTPILLLTLAVLIGAGMWNAPAASDSVEGALHHFQQGLKGGYQTLDLTAALLFATLVFPYIARGNEGGARKMLGASCIAAGLLMASYIGLCHLAAHHGVAGAPEGMLHAIALNILGPAGGLIAGAAVFLACLTTNVTLAALFAEYLRREFFQGRGGLALPLSLTLGVTAAMANIGFTGIMQALGPVLEVLYPGLIALCLYNIYVSRRVVSPST